MGRKPSNVYDYFIRMEPEPGRKSMVRYQCKKCDKQYACNATRLAEHLRTSCAPGFQHNQKPRRSSLPPTKRAATTTVVVQANSNTDAEEEEEEEEETQETQETADTMAATMTSLAVPSSNGYTPSGVETAQSLALKRADQQLLTNMLEAEADTSQDVTEVLLRLAKLSTCVIGDAMAQLKIRGHLVDVNLVRGYDAPLAMNICGPALTVKMVPTGGARVGGGLYDYMDTADMGQVVVISSPLGVTTAAFGGLLATASKARNVAGVVTDGRVRDIQELCTMNFPAFAAGTSVHGVYASMTVGEVNGSIEVAGCVVRPNDIIRGDVNGVLVVPADQAQDIATRAEIIEDQDSKIIEAVHEGEPLQRSLHRFRSSRQV